MIRFRWYNDSVGHRLRVHTAGNYDSQWLWPRWSIYRRLEGGHTSAVLGSSDGKLQWLRVAI